MSDSILPEGGGRTSRRQKLALADPTKIDRLPPHSIDAEQGVLGCIMLAPQDCLPEVIEHFGSRVEIFYDLRHQEIYRAMLGMFEANRPIDLLTLSEWLKKETGDRRQETEWQSVGIAYLSSLPDAVPSAANLSYYAEIVFEKYQLRKMITTCTDVVARAYEFTGDVEELLDGVERDILKLAEDRSGALPTMKALVGEALAKMETLFNNQGALTGLGTGFPDLDRMTGGLQPGDMIVIAARPSLGKTSLAVNIAVHVAA